MSVKEKPSTARHWSGSKISEIMAPSWQDLVAVTLMVLTGQSGSHRCGGAVTTDQRCQIDGHDHGDGGHRCGSGAVGWPNRTRVAADLWHLIRYAMPRHTALQACR